MRPVLDHLRDHLISKNVAAEIANKLCDSVAEKLEGKVGVATCIVCYETLISFGCTLSARRLVRR